MKKKFISTLLILFSFTLVSCNSKYHYDETKINVTTTTNIVADMVKQIGKDKVNVYSLMGAGVDPHQYVARPLDYIALSKADLIVVSGLHLEGKMVDIFEEFGKQLDAHVLSLGNSIINYSESVYKDILIESESFGGNYDPHFWFDIDLYLESLNYIFEQLILLDSENISFYENNLNSYKLEVLQLDLYIKNEVCKLSDSDKVLITAHDAFEYFGNRYGFKVYSLQGLSTEDEVSPSDVKEIIDIILKENIKAIFPETSVPTETISSVKEALSIKGIKLIVGNDLYSDSIGDKSDDNTYLKMYKKNVDNIVSTILGGI